MTLGQNIYSNNFGRLQGSILSSTLLSVLRLGSHKASNTAFFTRYLLNGIPQRKKASKGI
ncbi:11153_t:CDS:2 [Funneliformis mosseae]|uniref:11153_t:CDS:1 n=1 Tax=Funneliformis mosseae TaxID=27381 RepID=A0A9N8Z109_FUNMO|nr:11153_t:CDS:2 [Funneliformis mosseae]